MLLRCRRIRSLCRPGRCQGLPLPRLPDAARRPHAVGGDFSQTRCAVHCRRRPLALFRQRAQSLRAVVALQSELRVVRHTDCGRGPEHVARIPDAVRFRRSTPSARRLPAVLPYLLSHACNRRNRWFAEMVRAQGAINVASGKASVMSGFGQFAPLAGLVRSR